MSKIRMKVIELIRKLKSDLLPSAIFIALSLSFFYNPLDNIEVTSFDRTMGHGLMMGVDVSARISNFYTFFIIALSFLLIWVLLSYFAKYNEETMECIKFIKIISTIAIVPLCVALRNKFVDGYELGVSIYIIFSIILILLLYITVFYRWSKIFRFRTLKWSIFSSIPCLLLGITLCSKYNISMNYIRLAVLLFAIITTLFILTSLLKIKIENLIIAFYPIIIAPILVSIFLEGCNVLNQYNIIVNSKYKWTMIIYSVVITCGVLLYLLIRKKTIKYFEMEKWYYPTVLISIVLSFVQLPIQFETFKTDLFETANYGLGISEFLNYGKIPIVETFDAHMISGEPLGILYGLLNNDYIGALFNPYQIYMYIILFLIIYYFFSCFFNKDIALFLCLLYPIILDQGLSYYYIGISVILAVVYAYKKKTYSSYILYWIAVAITCLYTLDIGLSFVIGSIIAQIILWIYNRKNVNLKKMSLSLILILGLCLTVFFILCSVKGISPINRIIELLKISMSNINWSFESIGNPNGVSFAVFYIFVPIIVISLIIKMVFEKFIGKETIDEKRMLIILTIGLTYIINLPRGLVRHSMAENSLRYVVYSAPLFIALMIASMVKRKKLAFFLGAYSIVLLVSNLMVSTGNLKVISLLESGTEKFLKFEQYKSTFGDKINRVVISDNMKQIYLPVKETVDKLISPEETYLDFTNQSLIYGLIGREKPVYINQSPGLLSGEVTQQMFLEEIKDNFDKVSLILMPFSDLQYQNFGLSKQLDNINNSYRYYLVSEFIYNNYTPLVKCGNLSLWCKKDELSKKQEIAEENKYEIINYSSQEMDSIHSNDLSQIPYIWATYDQIKVNSKEVQAQILNKAEYSGGEKIVEMIVPSEIDKSEGNYILITADSDETAKVTLNLGNAKNRNLANFTFDTTEGKSINYLIRISSDYYWYSDLIDSISISSDKDLKNLNISVLKGDTLK